MQVVFQIPDGCSHCHLLPGVTDGPCKPSNTFTKPKYCANQGETYECSTDENKDESPCIKSRKK